MQKILDQIQNELPLSGDSADDGRYVWTERWNRLHELASESQRLLIAANKAKERLHEWFCSACIWASTNPDSIKYQLHTGSSTESMKFDTLEDLEAWVDSLSLGGSREILHRKFKL